ncbi:hypothetical protein Rleg10DRAFT_3454 [Rhizobium leguminosarum bv. trifolii WSM2012]|nr:hypothetical protein Rleg10DRAFT_3454 [Rhizobium leguminosarum bv. trifolii WSM2012]
MVERPCYLQGRSEVPGDGGLGKNVLDALDMMLRHRFARFLGGGDFRNRKPGREGKIFEAVASGDTSGPADRCWARI